MPRLGARPLVGLGDIDRAGPAELLRCRLVAVFSGPLAIGVVVARDEIGRGKRHEKRIFATGMRRPSDRLARPLRRDPDRRMLAVIGPRPEIDVLRATLVPVNGDATRLGSGGD